MSISRGQHLIGKKIGSCVLEKLLGYGGSSAVYLARQHSPERQVAVKVFLPRFNMNAQMQKNFYNRFLREAEAASELDHPHILSILSYGEQDGLPYIIMPYMSGGTLSEYVKKHGPLSLSQAQRYLEQIAAALDYAHEHGCVHCDVKPANILLDSEGNAMLSDFGIAYLLEAESASPHQILKSPETLVGTPDYISPEQALGQNIDGRSDVYSLGVTLYFLLAGSPPFIADSSIAMALLHVHEPPPSLGLMRIDITPLIDRVIGKALSKWPEDRFQTPGEFARAFSEAISYVGNTRGGVFRAKSDKISARPSGAKSNDQAWRMQDSRVSISVRPIQQHSSHLSLKRLAIALLLLLTLGSLLAFTASTWFRNAHPQVHHTTSTHKVTPIASQKPPLSNLLDDKLAWIQGNNFFFKDGAYYIRNTYQDAVAMSLCLNGLYNDFRLSVAMTQITSSHQVVDYYGVIFRSTIDQLHYYVFDVAADGTQFNFMRFDYQGKNNSWHYLESGDVKSLKPNLMQKNVISIEAKGNTFSFLINNVPVGKSVVDTLQPVLNSGEVGLYVETNGAEVAFTNLQVLSN